jgi:hypothetical protein
MKIQEIIKLGLPYNTRFSLMFKGLLKLKIRSTVLG